MNGTILSTITATDLTAYAALAGFAVTLTITLLKNAAIQAIQAKAEIAREQAALAQTAAAVANAKADGNTQRLEAQHDIQQGQQQQLAAVSLQTPTTPAAIPAPIVRLDHVALADAIHAKLVAAAKPSSWPAPAVTLPHVTPKA